MDFFEHQERARKMTSVLVSVYVLCVALIILAIYSVVVIGLRGNWQWDPDLLGVVAVSVGAIISIGTLVKIIGLSRGGKVVAEMLGGRLISPQTQDLSEKKILNVVEEMAIASGVPVPPVYILEEEGINAFAAGTNPKNAVIGITRGCINKLNRDELQGVVAHEFSHILNGDMRLNIRLIGVLFGILLIAIIGRIMIRMGTMIDGQSNRRSSKKKGGGGIYLILIGLGLTIIGYIGVFFARLIKSAVSRQREFLADASAVQFTRNPDGIARALRKILDHSRGSRINSPHAEEASHLFFADGLVGSFLNLFATHPPLQERIRRINPEWLTRSIPASQPDVAHQKSSKVRKKDYSEGEKEDDWIEKMPFIFAVQAKQISQQIGTLTPQHLAYASSILQKIPSNLREAIRDPIGAQATIYAMLLASSGEEFQQQQAILQRGVDPQILAKVSEIKSVVRHLPIHFRMPLMDMIIPVLQQLSLLQYQQFRQSIDQMIHVDKKVTLFEFVLLQTLWKHLDSIFYKHPDPPVRYYSFKPLLAHILPILFYLALLGNETNQEQALKDFQEALKTLGIDPTVGRPSLPEDPVSILRQGLEKILHAEGPIKKRFIEACVTAVAADGRITVEEAELVRVIGDYLGCPMPPILPNVD